MGWLWGDSDSSKSSESPYESSSFDTSSGMGSSFDSPSSSSLSDLSSSFDSGPSGSSGAGGEDAELQKFLQMEQQKAQMQTMIHKMNDLCWDTCVGAPDNKLNSRTETCIGNCVERFIDSSLFIANRFATQLSKQAGGM